MKTAVVPHSLLTRARRALVAAKCRFCAGDVATSDGVYRKKPDAEWRHWSMDGVDYYSCGLSDADRRLVRDLAATVAP